MNTDIDLRNCLLSNFCNLIPVHLDGSNYVTWKFLLDTMLRGCGLMKYVDGSFPCPSQYMITKEGGVLSEMTAEYLTWKQNDYAVMTLLVATLSSGVLSFVVGSNTSRDLWCLLKERYASTSWFNKEQLKSNFYKLQKGSDSIDNYLDRVKIACDQLANVEIHMTDEDIIVSVLLGLPSAYTTMKTIIRAKHNPISMQELRSLLLIAEAELEEVDKSLSLPSTAEIIAQDDNIKGSTPAPTLITNAKSDVNSMMPTSSVASSIGYNVHSMSNSSPSQSASSPGPQPLYMTDASSPCTPTFVDYLQTSYLGFPQPSANTCLTQPIDFFAHNNGGMLQRFGAHMPQMQTNSYLLQLVAPSTFTPCHASHDYAVMPSVSISNGAPHSMPNSGYGMINGTGNENFNGGCMAQNSGYNHVPQYNHSQQQGFFLNNDSSNGMPPQQGFHSLSTNITYSAAGYTEDKMNCPNFSNRGTNYFNRGCDYKDDNNKPRSNNLSPHNPIVCQICGKRGHCAYNCYQRNSQPHNIALSSYVKCQICRTSGHIAKLCRYKQQSQTSSQPKSASIAAQPSSCSSMPLISPG